MKRASNPPPPSGVRPSPPPAPPKPVTAADFPMTNAELADAILRTQRLIGQTNGGTDAHRMHVEHLRDLLIFERARAGAVVIQP